MLGSFRISPFSRKSSSELIYPLLSTSTPPTTYNNVGDFYTTYNFGSDLQTPMAGSVTGTSDFIEELAYTYGRIIYMTLRREKTKLASVSLVSPIYVVFHNQV